MHNLVHMAESAVVFMTCIVKDILDIFGRYYLPDILSSQYGHWTGGCPTLEMRDKFWYSCWAVSMNYT